MGNVLQHGPRLPIELCEHVIDSLWDDVDKPDVMTLRSCALACRAWYPRSQYNLFQVIELTTLKNLHSLSRVLTSFRLQSYVRELNVKHADDDHPFQLMTAFPALLARKLPSLELLTLESPYTTPSVTALHPSYFILLSEFRSMTSLGLFHMEFQTFADFARLLCAFPRLVNLECWNVTWLGHCYNPFDLSHYAKALNLQSLIIDDVETTGLARVMKSVCSSLHHLTFVADNEWTESFINERSSTLWGLTSLQTLQLPIRLNRTDFEWVQTLLSHITPDQPLRKLVLLFHYGFGEEPLRLAKDALSNMQRAGIDDVLSLPQFSTLDEVIFRFSSPDTIDIDSDKNHWKSGLVSQLPKLAQRGVIKVELHD